jgi:predicted ABC-type ATPase
MANLYIIAGCNGVGKTTASKSFLPKRLKCKEFINADEIARGLSPFQPETVAITAGKIMLSRIDDLINNNKDFAVETTLTSFQTKSLIESAKKNNYKISLIFIYLDSEELAIKRVKNRVKNGGHDVEKDVIKRRFSKGISNFFNFYKNKVDYWILINNSKVNPKIVADGSNSETVLYKPNMFEKLKGFINEGID